jgi:hypothetical protein
LRALAVLAVIWHHSTPRQLEGWLGRGHLGVQLFFCISGFLITTLLLDERRDTGELGLFRFWWRRGLAHSAAVYGCAGAFRAARDLAAREPDARAFLREPAGLRPAARRTGS